jgi:P27 family predicted phage terminase small subunit
MSENGRVPKAPGHLGAAGRAVWAAAWAVSWTASPDRSAIRHLARLEDAAQELCAVLDRDGVTQERPIVTPKGEICGSEYVSHPALGELRKLDKPLLELRAALGLDPQSRARLKLAVQDEPSVVDELSARRRARLAGNVTEVEAIDRRIAEKKAKAR